jgi:hypothetical protein
MLLLRIMGGDSQLLLDNPIERALFRSRANPRQLSRAADLLEILCSTLCRMRNAIISTIRPEVIPRLARR